MFNYFIKVSLIVALLVWGCNSGPSPNAIKNGGSPAGGSTSVGGTVPAGGTPAGGTTFPLGGTVPTGGTVPAGGTIADGGRDARPDVPVDVPDVPDASPDSSIDVRPDGPIDIRPDTPDVEPQCNSSSFCYAFNCGPNADENCCTRLTVYGGYFYRNFDGIDFVYQSYPATVNDFCLDKFEVTVGQFRGIHGSGLGTQGNPPVAGAGAHPLISGSGWNSDWNTFLPVDEIDSIQSLKCDGLYLTYTDVPAYNENRPQNCLNWYRAFAFCAQNGDRLATESELNYAASGGNEQRQYPWGTGLDPSKASYYVDDIQQCMGDGVPGCSIYDLINVGTKPLGNGRWGQADLAGNTRTWTLDYHQDILPMPCSNCAVLEPTQYRTLHGGFFNRGDTGQLRSASRDYVIPETRSATIGFRCAH